MKTQVAYRQGVCALCGGLIATGGEFVWGPYGTKERHHVTCAAGEAPPTRETVTTKLAEVAEKTVLRPLSVQQQAAVDWALKSTGNASMEAVAGSGKTFTIEAIFRALTEERPNASYKYLVFNASNAREAQQRMPRSVDTSTFHSAGLKALANKLQLKDLRSAIDGKKLGKLLDKMEQSRDITAREYDNLGTAAIKLCELAKRHGVDAIIPSSEEKWLDLLKHYDVQVEFSPSDYKSAAEAEARAIEVAQALLAASNKQLDVIDFDDMLYLVLRLQVRMPQYDFIGVDEAQDSNPTRRALLRLMLKDTGRLLVVGDRRQAIYGFTGAENDAMDRLAEDFNCITLPLSVNYRCGRAIIEAAQVHCPEITAWEKAPEGSVEYLPTMNLKDFKAGDAVLCRLTAPEVGLAYKMLAARVAGDVDYNVRVLGRDIGAGLVSLIKKLQGKSQMSVDTLLVKLDEWQEREVARWTAKGEDEKVQGAIDKAESIRIAVDALAEDQRTIVDLISGLQSIFADQSEIDPNSVTLSTVHKSKGLEWDTVYVLDPWRMPSPWAKQPWQREQETNLSYVAVTRAKNNLRNISLEDIQR